MAELGRLHPVLGGKAVGGPAGAEELIGAGRPRGGVDGGVVVVRLAMTDRHHDGGDPHAVAGVDVALGMGLGRRRCGGRGIGGNRRVGRRRRVDRSGGIGRRHGGHRGLGGGRLGGRRLRGGRLGGRRLGRGGGGLGGRDLGGRQLAHDRSGGHQGGCLVDLGGHGTGWRLLANADAGHGSPSQLVELLAAALVGSDCLIIGAGIDRRGACVVVSAHDHEAENEDAHHRGQQQRLERAAQNRRAFARVFALGITPLSPPTPPSAPTM